MDYHDNKQYKYFLYARKSSESEDRQVQSIDDQTDRLKELAQTLGITIKQIFTEAKSAKKPNNRPVFTEMMERIEAGEADGILCWQINRLSRNPIDSAQIQWLLQKKVLKSIQTIDREYRPEDNVLLFNVESGMANQFILDLSKNVKRGNLCKVKNGWKPGLAPIGYLNELENHTIIPDPERFDLIRRAWDYMLTGNYTVPQIHKMLNDDWGFRTKKRKRSGGKPVALSSMYKIFSNIFYAGVLLYDGKEYAGKHKTMITLEEYDQVQVILGKKGKPRPKTYTFAFTGMIRCGECGCSITAEKKKKFIKSEQELRYYTYYHCTRRKREVNCSQRKSISETTLENLILEEVGKLTILPEFFDWAMEALNQDNDNEIVDRTKIYEMQHQSLTKTQKELDNLTKMRYRELIDDEMFIKESEELKAKIKKLQQELRETEKRAEDWLELTEKAFHFARYAREHFDGGSIEEKKEVLSGLGSNFLLKDQKLDISLHSYFEPIKNGYKTLEAEYLALEPNKFASTKVKTEALTSVITRWQAR
ncbi:recombinase family protein [Candidatus Nomurabacteria bacterium]|nr:recombinase family protein [Candidatus Nomurabacteria bacterium]